MRALILDGPGALGPALATELGAAGVETVLAGRDPGRYEQPLNLRGDLGDLYHAAGRAAVVVNLTDQQDRRLAERATAAGAAFVELGGAAGYLSELAGLPSRTPVVAGARLIPVLAGLLAQDVLGRSGAADPVEIGAVLGAGDPQNAVDTGSTYPLLGTYFTDPATGDEVRNFGDRRRVELPDGSRRAMVRVNFPDQHLLTAALGHPVRTWFATGDSFTTAVFGALTRVRAAGRIPGTFHFPGSDGWLVFARAGQGGQQACSWATGHTQTPSITRILAAVARRAPTLSPGLHRVQDLLTLSDLAADANLTLARSGAGLPRNPGGA